MTDALARRLAGATVPLAIAAALLAGPAHAHENPPPSAPAAPGPPDTYSRYESESTCGTAVRPGTLATRDLLLAPHYAGPTWDYGMLRPCNQGGPSGHKEGRALDWMMCTCDPHENAHARSFLAWLLAPDAQGVAHANARRMGVMYVIFDRRIWRAYRAAEGWQPYSGPSPHTDHIHLSLTWAGADRLTSFWATPGLAPGSLGAYPGGVRLTARSDAVARYERRLHVLGLLRAERVDGYYGTDTDRATRALQAQRGLVVDGVVGPRTWAAADGAAPPPAPLASATAVE